MLAATVSAILLVRAWDRVEARLAVFGLLLVLLPTRLLVDLGVPSLVVAGADLPRVTGYLTGMTTRHLGRVILPASMAMAVFYGGVAVTTLLLFAGVEYLFEEQVTRLVTLPDAVGGWIAAVASAAAFGPLQGLVRHRLDELLGRSGDARPDGSGERLA